MENKKNREPDEHRLELLERIKTVLRGCTLQELELIVLFLERRYIKGRK